MVRCPAAPRTWLCLAMASPMQPQCCVVQRPWRDLSTNPKTGIRQPYITIDYPPLAVCVRSSFQVLTKAHPLHGPFATQPADAPSVCCNAVLAQICLLQKRQMLLLSRYAECRNAAKYQSGLRRREVRQCEIPGGSRPCDGPLRGLGSGRGDELYKDTVAVAGDCSGACGEEDSARVR